MAAEDKETIVAIDLLRFVCAVAVMSVHFGVGFWRDQASTAHALLAGTHWSAPHEAWLGYGWLGVELFFVISGAVIAASVASGGGAATFLRRRILRLVPAVWICATLTLVVATAAIGFDAGLAAGWARSVMFWPLGRQVDASYWTLGIELSFYLLMTVAIARLGSQRAIRYVATLLAGASAAFWAAVLLHPALVPIANDRIASLLLLPHGCFFAIGMGLAAWRDAGMRVPLVLALGAGVIEVLAHATVAGHYGVPVQPVVALAVFAGGVGVVGAAALLQPALRRIVPPTVARTLGLMTYPLYLLHQFAGAIVAFVLIAHGMPVGIALLACAGLSVGAAWLIAGHAEPWLRAWLARWLSPGRWTSLRRALARDNRPIASLPGD